MMLGFSSQDANYGDWILLQQRKGSPDLFNVANWAEYRDGFGQKNDVAFWLGLEKMRQETKIGKWQLVLHWEFLNEPKVVQVIYDDFKIDSDDYRLRIGSRVWTHNLRS